MLNNNTHGDCNSFGWCGKKRDELGRWPAAAPSFHGTPHNEQVVATPSPTESGRAQYMAVDSFSCLAESGQCTVAVTLFWRSQLYYSIDIIWKYTSWCI
jgi:hypothetical protein